MLRVANGSVLISVVVMLFATLLVATPTLAFLTQPHEHPAETPRPPVRSVSAFA
ncbi:hypothetical protein V5F29_00890 [Xanthobacter aminoxidans]|uniref:hypothetical protein n=1 Tax=Xanthobacter aminoxidans TaxID=186280 RepID=UPI00372C49EB